MLLALQEWFYFDLIYSLIWYLRRGVSSTSIGEQGGVSSTVSDGVPTVPIPPVNRGGLSQDDRGGVSMCPGSLDRALTGGGVVDGVPTGLPGAASRSSEEMKLSHNWYYYHKI